MSDALRLGDFARCPGWRISWISPGLVFTAGKKPLETMQGLSAGRMKESLGELFVRCRFTISSHFRLCQFCSSYNAIRFMPKRLVSNSVAVAVLRRFTGSSNPTRVKLRWDDHFLYVGAELRFRWGVLPMGDLSFWETTERFVDFVDACWRFKTGQWLLVLLAIAMTYTVLFGQAQCCGGLEDRAQCQEFLCRQTATYFGCFECVL